MTKVVIYLLAVFFILYGLRSAIAGYRNEKKAYWISIEYDPLEKWKYRDRVQNFVLGIVLIIAGVAIFFHY